MKTEYRCIANALDGIGLAKLREIYHASPPDYFKKICRGGPDYFIAGLNVPWARAVLAYTDDAISGFCFLGEPEAVADIQFVEIIYLAAAAKGDGPPLLAASERDALNLCSRPTFKVQSAGATATQFYLRNGYLMWNRQANVYIKLFKT